MAGWQGGWVAEWKSGGVEEYVPEQDEPQIVSIPAGRFLMIDGEGSPSSPEFGLEGDALVRVSFALQLNRRLSPLEALWWTADGSPMGYGNLEQWRWTAMLPCPLSTGDEAVSKAIAGAALTENANA